MASKQLKIYIFLAGHNGTYTHWFDNDVKLACFVFNELVEAEYYKNSCLAEILLEKFEEDEDGFLEELMCQYEDYQGHNETWIEWGYIENHETEKPQEFKTIASIKKQLKVLKQESFAEEDEDCDE